MSGAERLLVFVDGEEKGTTPLELSLAPGAYHVEVKAAEYAVQGVSGDPVVKAGQTTAIIGDWESGKFTEDRRAVTSRLRFELTVGSAISEALPSDLLGGLLSAANVKLFCGTEPVPVRFEREPVENAPHSTLLRAEELPVGACRLESKVLGKTEQTKVQLNAGKETVAKGRLAVRWMRVELTRLEAGDKVILARAGKNKIPLIGRRPSRLFPSGPLEVVVTRDATDYIVLKKAGAQGTIRVEPYGQLVLPEETRVSGLQVTIGGEELPVEGEYLLPVGQHEVALVASGRHAVERTISVVAGQTTTWSESLAEVARARVQVTVAGPEEWTLFANGTKVEDPKELSLLPGNQQVRVEAPGWEAAEESVSVTEGQDLELNLVLSPLPVDLHFEGLVADSRITITGEDGPAREMKAKGAELRVSLAPGTYGWVASAPQRITDQGEVVLVVGGGAKRVSVQLPIDPNILAGRRQRAVSAAIGGGAAALAGVGIFFVVDAQALYTFSEEQHALYKEATVAEDIIWYAGLSRDGVILGQERELLGFAFIGGATALAVTSVLIAVKSKSKVPARGKAVGVSFLPRQDGVSFGLAGRW